VILIVYFLVCRFASKKLSDEYQYEFGAIVGMVAVGIFYCLKNLLNSI